MATKPTHPANVQIVTLNNLTRNSRLMIPTSLLTKFAELMSLCSVVDTDWLQGNCETITVVGDVDYSIQSVGQKHVICDSDSQRREFSKFHDATYELTPPEERTNGRPVVTMDDFLKSLSDQAAKHTPTYERS